MEDKEFVTSDELKELCSDLGIKYESAIRHLVPRGRLIRVFRGVFYSYFVHLDAIKLNTAGV